MTPSPSRSRLNPQYAARLSAASSSVAAGVGSPSSYCTPRKKHPRSPSSMSFVSNSSSSIKVRMNAKNSPSRRQNYSNSIMASPSSVFSSPSSGAGVSTNSSYVYSDRFIPSRITSSLEDYMDCYQDENNCVHHTQVRSDPSISPAMINNSNLDNTANMAAASATTAAAVMPNDEATVSTNVSGVGDVDADMSGAVRITDSGSVGMGVGNIGRRSPLMSHQPYIGPLLRSEFLGETMSNTMIRSSASSNHNTSHRNISTPPRNSAHAQLSSPSPSRLPITFTSKNSLRFQSPKHGRNPLNSILKPFNNLSQSAQHSLGNNVVANLSQHRKRRIAKVPFKVLDAPSLQDDFYLNLVDWSSENVLAVGLGSCVYLWSACTSKVTKLCDLVDDNDLVSSVAWTKRGMHLAVGTNSGDIQLWDAVKCQKIRTLTGHSARVGTLCWSGPTLASGSRDRSICLRDARTQESSFTVKMNGHKQEVCGLKWSYNEPVHLASGGNDNKLLVWDVRNSGSAMHRFTQHVAAVKAITWSPHQNGLLASGGGTADRCIRFWNTVSGSCLSCVDTGSQVCNLAWSQNCNEIVSTHGYSLNQIVVWKYPNMEKVATLTGHTYRVLYLSMSPDGSTICTGAGDETIRFWQVFPGPRSCDKNTGAGLLFPVTPGSVIR